MNEFASISMREIFKRSADVVSEFADAVEHVGHAGADTADEVADRLNYVAQNWNARHFVVEPPAPVCSPAAT